VVGVVAWWLERWQTELDVSQLTLERLRDVLPGWKSYGLGSEPGHSALNRHWNVYHPPDTLDTRFAGTYPDMDF